MTDSFREPPAHVTCPNCGKPVSLPRMNVCYIARVDCENCGAAILVEGDKVTVETPPSA